MRNLSVLNCYRVVDQSILDRFGSIGDHTCGMFEVPSPIDGQTLRVIASNGEGWDHVSVSRSSRCPNWPEMTHIKNMFFQEAETAMQLHVPSTDHVNYHSYCLHLWRPHDQEIPRPPAWMVGPVGVERKTA